MLVLKSGLTTCARAFTRTTRAMSSISVSLRDEKKALRKSIKEKLAEIPREEVVDQCAMVSALLSILRYADVD